MEGGLADRGVPGRMRKRPVPAILGGFRAKPGGILGLTDSFHPRIRRKVQVLDQETGQTTLLKSCARRCALRRESLRHLRRAAIYQPYSTWVLLIVTLISR
jgi:hypothetical protein